MVDTRFAARQADNPGAAFHLGCKDAGSEAMFPSGLAGISMFGLVLRGTLGLAKEEGRDRCKAPNLRTWVWDLSYKMNPSKERGIC